jgi:hypothetical protein
MSEKKIVVPKGMLKAAGLSTDGIDPEGYFIYTAIEAALRWLSENPIVPSDEQVGEMLAAKSQFYGHFVPADWIRWGATDWQRRMFLALEPEVPGLDDVLESFIAYMRVGGPNLDEVEAKLEAYRRGQQVGSR